MRREAMNTVVLATGLIRGVYDRDVGIAWPPEARTLVRGCLALIYWSSTSSPHYKWSEGSCQLQECARSVSHESVVPSPGSL